MREVISEALLTVRLSESEVISSTVKRGVGMLLQL
jgi:hypothetical protein